MILSESLDCETMFENEYHSIEHSKFSSNHPQHSRISLFSKDEKDIPCQYDDNLEREIDDFLGRINNIKFQDDQSLIQTTKEYSLDHHPSLENMTFIYVISNHVYSEKNMYKIGKHKGTKKMLIKRYKTYLIDPMVYFFFPTGSAAQDESILLDRLSNFRVGTSEFINLSIDKLLDWVSSHFKNKYQRCPSVQIPYHRCLYNQTIYDIFEKTIKYHNLSYHRELESNQFKRCLFLPYLDFTDPYNCLKYLDITLNRKEDIIYRIDICRFNDTFDLLNHHGLIGFMRSFTISFDKMNYVLYLNRFIEEGLNCFFIQWMKQMYGYHSFSLLSRKEFLQKESFHERLILVHRSQNENSSHKLQERNLEEPLDILLEKIRFINCCVVIEDDNIYSLENKKILSNIKFEDLFYYFFYIL
jgi:hypothetical protein